MTLVERSSEPQIASGFAALRLGEPVQRALDEIGYSEPTPVQAATYPLAVAGRDIIVQARTGTGKTAAFGIPLVDKLVTSDRHVQALVLAPTRELALQSQREISRIGQHKRVHVVAIYGGAPMGKQVDELQSGAQIVSGTPGRVLDHLRRGTFDPSHLRVLVLDEMDEMLSMGFAKELSAILEFIPDRSKRQTMCFSATVDGEVRRHAERHMNEPEMVALSSDAVGVEQITHFAYMVPGSDRPADLVRILEVEDPESAIIFCNMRSETERVAGALNAAGFNADWLNGDLPQKDRERIMEDTRQGKLRYLVATDVAARGIDISHLTHVINYTFPESAAVYVHRTGRTGRAGRTGCAVSLVSPDELGRLYYLRLEYKISPIERSLPTRGELNTRAEFDRILLLENAFSGPPAVKDLAIARRLLTHPDVERILGGLLHTFLGTHGQVDEEAAAVRRTRKPAPVEREPQPAQDAERGRDDAGEAGRRRRRRGRGDRDERGVDEGVEGGVREEVAAEGGSARAQVGAEDRSRPTIDRGDRPRRDRDRPGPREGLASRDRGPSSREGGGAPREGAGAGAGRERGARDRGPRFPSRDREGGGERNRELSSQDRLEAGGERERGAGFAARERDGTSAQDELPFEGEAGTGRAAGPWSREGDYASTDREGSAREGEAGATGARRNEGGSSSSPRSRDREGQQPRRDRGPRDRHEGTGQRSRGEISRRERGEGNRERSPNAVTGDTGPSFAAPADERDGVLFDGFAQPSAASIDAGGAGDAAFPDPPTSRDLSPPPGVDDSIDSVWGESQPEGAQEHLSGLLYLNLGRRDGVRVNEVARLLRDECSMTRAEVGRIRVRDRYTYVDVPQERLDAIIEKLTGHTFHDKRLSPERARVVKT